METLADERDGHRVGAHAVARDAAGGVGGVETEGYSKLNLDCCAPLVLPEHETVLVQTNSSPIVPANQVHPVSTRDCEAATVAGLPETGSLP